MSLYFSPFARHNHAEVWPRYQSLLKLLFWTKDVEWVNVLNALGPLWQCLILVVCCARPLPLPTNPWLRHWFIVPLHAPSPFLPRWHRRISRLTPQLISTMINNLNPPNQGQGQGLDFESNQKLSSSLRLNLFLPLFKLVSSCTCKVDALVIGTFKDKYIWYHGF